MLLRKKPSSKKPSSRTELYTSVVVLAVFLAAATVLFAIPAWSQATTDGVTVFLNNGSGVYSTTPFNFPLPAGTDPSSIDRGDFNNDGKPDIVVTDLATDSVIVLLNTTVAAGNPTFSAPISTPLPGSGANPTDVAVGNFNGVGGDDLAVTNPGTNTVTILNSNGSGGFTNPQNISLPGALPTAVDKGDFNGDGKDDLVVANQGANNATILTNNGSGLFNTTDTVNVGNAPSDVITGDFTGDVKDDFATANAGADSISVALNNGTGSFPTPATPFPAQTSQNGTIVSELAVGNYNGSGGLDIAVTSPTDNIVQVLTGNGSGSFSAATPFTLTPTGTQPSGLTSGAFNGAGPDDLATSNFTSSNISVLLNPPMFQSPVTYPTSPATLPGNPVDIVKGNFDPPDGALDLAVAYSPSGGTTNTTSTTSTGTNTGTDTGTNTTSTNTTSNTTGNTTGNNNNNNNKKKNKNKNKRHNNNRRNGIFQYDNRRIPPGIFSRQYEDTSGVVSGNAQQYTGEGTSGNGGAFASSGPGGAEASTPGAVAQSGNPDQQQPVSTPQGNVVNEVPTQGPLPNTGGLSFLAVVLPVGGFLLLALAIIYRVRGSLRENR